MKPSDKRKIKDIAGKLIGNEGPKFSLDQTISDFIASKFNNNMKGEMPQHNWDGTRLSFENNDDTWGEAVDLKGEKGDQGEKGEQGEPGEDGFTPVFGVDYFDGEQGPQGEPGKDGYTPIKGKDYFDGKNGKDAPVLLPETVIASLKTLKGKDRLPLSAIADSEFLMKIGSRQGKKIDTSDQRWHGGGLSTVSHDGTLSGDGTPSSPLSVIGGGSQAGIQFQDEGVNLGTSGTVDTLDFTGAGVTASRIGNAVTVNVAGGGGGGTVTDFVFTNANGFTGSVATSTTTPTLTVGTSVTGIIKGNGTAMSAATDGTDYLSPTTGITVSQSTPQTLGSTGSRLTKLWATDITVTNPISGSITGNAATATALQTARTIGGVSFDGTANITVASATGGFTVSGGALSVTTTLTLEETGVGTDTITIQAPSSIAASYTLTLPVDDGTPNQVMTTDGSGVLSWTTPTTGTVTSVSGTSNRITSTGGATPVIDIAASYVGQTSITTLGTVTTGTLSTGAVIGGVTMTLGSDATGDMYYRNSSGVLTRVATAAQGSVLRVGAASVPSFGAIDLADTDAITGTLPLANGGTGLTSITALSIWAANSANTLVEVTATAGQSIRINGGGTAWEAFTPSAATPTVITVANEATDTTCFLGFFTAATGDLGPKTNANLTFNSSTGVATFGQTIVGSVNGNAATATALQNARTIGGVSFDGTANIVPQTIQSINEATDTTCFPLFISASGSQSLQPLNNAGFIYNSNANSLTATTFIGALTGNASTSTLAATATALANARTIGGVSFDGTANITVATATGGFTVSGGNLALGTNSITMSGSIGVTGTRVTKGWFTDLEVTNAIVGSITGNAATVTNATLTTALTVNTGTVTLVGNAANTSVLTIGAGAVSVSGANTGDQNLFRTFAVAGQSDVVADSTTDTLTLVAGTNVTITTDASTDTITINASGGGGITVGTTTITSGTNTKVLFNNAGVVGEYTISGSGNVAMTTSPSFTTPTLGVASATSINKVAITAPATSATLTIADGKTLTANNSITFAGTDSTTMTFPTTSATIARTDAANTFTGVQTMTSPSIATSLVTASSSFDLLNTTATTVNFAGAATTLNIGASATCILNFGGSTTASEFRFLEPSGSGTNYTAFKAVAQGANITYSLPATVGGAGTFLKDAAGDGVLSWATPSGSGGGDGGFALKYDFDTTTTSSPASGEIRYDNATLASVTNIYINKTDLNSVDNTNYFNSLLGGSLIMVANADKTKFHIFNQRDLITLSGSVYTIPVTYLNGTALFSDGDDVFASFDGGKNPNWKQKQVARPLTSVLTDNSNDFFNYDATSTKIIFMGSGTGENAYIWDGSSYSVVANGGTSIDGIRCRLGGTCMTGVSTAANVFRRSTDSGATWGNITSSEAAGSKWQWAHGAENGSSTTWIAFAVTTNTTKFVRSTDDGATVASITFTTTTVFRNIAANGTTGATAEWLALSSSGTTRKSTDNGATWASGNTLPDSSTGEYIGWGNGLFMALPGQNNILNGYYAATVGTAWSSFALPIRNASTATWIDYIDAQYWLADTDGNYWTCPDITAGAAAVWTWQFQIKAGTVNAGAYVPLIKFAADNKFYAVPAAKFIQLTP